MDDKLEPVIIPVTDVGCGMAVSGSSSEHR
jgi:hypothetical protein